MTDIDAILVNSQTESAPVAPKTEAPAPVESPVPDAPDAPDVPHETSDVPTDDYGTPIQEKTYTKQEVQKMFQERFGRGKQPEPQQPPPPPPQYSELQVAEGDWMQELEQVIERTITKREQIAQHQQMAQQEMRANEIFDQKLKEGSIRYDDFYDVTGDAPITPHMLLGTRELDDPTGFLYAAAKNHKAELQRISQLSPSRQMVEIGRLEATIKKVKTVTKAPPPLQKVGQSASKDSKRYSNDIDHLIAQDQAARYRR